MFNTDHLDGLASNTYVIDAGAITIATRDTMTEVPGGASVSMAGRFTSTGGAINLNVKESGSAARIRFPLTFGGARAWMLSVSGLHCHADTRGVFRAQVQDEDNEANYAGILWNHRGITAAKTPNLSQSAMKSGDFADLERVDVGSLVDCDTGVMIADAGGVQQILTGISTSANKQAYITYGGMTGEASAVSFRKATLKIWWRHMGDDTTLVYR